MHELNCITMCKSAYTPTCIVIHFTFNSYVPALYSQLQVLVNFYIALLTCSANPETLAVSYVALHNFQQLTTLNSVHRPQAKIVIITKPLIQTHQYNLVILDFVNENDVFPNAE